MSAIDSLSSLNALGSLSSLSAAGGSGLPIVSQADEPAAVRNGGKTAQNAYNTGLEFESLLVSQLTQALTATAGLSGDSGDDGSDGDSDGSSDGSSGVLGSDPASSEYAQLLPGALTSSIMSAGGLGLAMPIAESIDPSLMTASASAGATAANGDGATASSAATASAAAQGVTAATAPVQDAPGGSVAPTAATP